MQLDGPTPEYAKLDPDLAFQFFKTTLSHVFNETFRTKPAVIEINRDSKAVSDLRARLMR